MKLSIKIAALAAALALTGCASGEFERNVQKMRENNPLKNFGKKKTDPAPVTTGTTTPRTAETTPVASSPQTSSAPNYDLPTGGSNTISLSVASCLTGCPITNVLLDPDNYWQRSSPEGVTTGQGRAGLYNEVVNVFQAEGFYSFQGELDIVQGNAATCSDYEAGEQAFFISLSRNNARRRINYDTGCAGSNSADAAADAINSLIGIRDFMNVVSGQ